MSKTRIAQVAPVEPQPLTTGGDRTIAERAFGAVHAAIVNGQFAPGHRLRIEELAAMFQISPTPIREALHRLEAVGLVENIPHRGARVTELSLDDLRDLYEARLRLEPLAIRKAAERFTPESAAAASGYLAAIKTAERRKAFDDAWKAHTQFHFALYRASGSPWLVRLITPLWESSQRYRLRLVPLRKDLERRSLEHEQILHACTARDAKVAEARLRQHLITTANRIAIAMQSPALFAVRHHDD
jgi:DNA-binding GntR family transcriptional regulator